MKIALVIPTYNEVGNIFDILESIRAQLPYAQMIVVDDSSPDGTAEKVQEYMKRDSATALWIREKKEGLGKAYQYAFQKLLNDPSIEAIGMMDADFSHDPKYLPELHKALLSADVVIGSRYVSGGETEGWEKWRVFLSKYGNKYCGWITGMKVADTTAGFCMFRSDSLKKASVESLSSAGYAFQMELKYRLWKQGARIVEIPIVFRNRREGESKISRHIISEGFLAPWKMRFGKRL